MAEPRFLVAIPVFNEEKYVSQVLSRVRDFCADVLVIDDGSTDGTADILSERDHLPLIQHPRNLGYGRSLADAFDYAARQGFDWLITIDCDEQHEPEFIPRFMEHAQANNVDLISGSRYLDTFKDNNAPPADRQMINARITTMLNERLGLSITDSFCGFKAYRVSALAGMTITEPGYAMPMQFWVQATQLCFRIDEIPVPLIYNDPNRHFGGDLDDPAVRFDHYMAVFESELTRTRIPATSANQGGTICAAC